MVRKTLLVLGCCCVCLASCNGGMIETSEFDTSQAAVTMDNVTQVFCAVEEANHGRAHNGRLLAWKEGNYDADGSDEQPTCVYGWCGPDLLQPGCNSTVQVGDEDAYIFGGCNSTTWGEQFAATMWHDGERLYEDYAYGSSFAEGITGTTTFGWHPYWTVTYNGTCRTLQGWSYEGHCGSSTGYNVSGVEPSPDQCSIDYDIVLEDRNVTAGDGVELRWNFTIPATGTEAIVSMFGGIGDGDLYVKMGSAPTTSSYDCRPYLVDNRESCTVSGPGEVYVMVRAWDAISGVALLGSVNGESDGGGATCGDGTCDVGETCTSCSADCGACPPSVYCGDGSCNGDENCATCPGDCGACGPVCGNGSCESGEDCANCVADCGECGGGGTCPVMSYSASGTNGASYTDSDTVKFPVNLTAGVEYTISTCGSTTTDTYLRLHFNDAQQAENDDGCGGAYQSTIVYTPAASGEFVISAGCYSTSSCSATVTVSPEASCGGDDPGVVCGDGSCDSGEDCANCAADCGECSGGGTCPVMDYSAASTYSASYTDPDTVKFPMILTAGVEYTISTCGSTSTDTYLRLHLNGAQQASNDDACGGQSSITYTPSVGGEFVVSAGCYYNYSCSATVTVSPEPSCGG